MKYIKKEIKDTEYFLLDLDQKAVEKRIIADMDAGVDVYYDRRWEVTELLTDWLEAHHEVYEGKRVLVLGAGVGAETLVLGKLVEKLFINDLSPTALELSAEQLDFNGIGNHEALLGRYEDVEIPKVDLIVASFLVYNKETLTAMRAFMETNDCEFILMNENLKEFKKFLTEAQHEVVFESEGAMCVKFSNKKC